MKNYKHLSLFIICFLGIFYISSTRAQSESWRYKGNLIHNGEAVFPIGYWMELNPIDRKEASVEVLGKAGFDMVTYGVSRTFKERMKRVISTANQYGMRVMYGLYGSSVPISPEISPTQDWVLQDDGIEIRNNPALLGYYHSDDVNNLTAAELDDKQALVKSIDNKHLTFHSSSVAIFSTNPEYVSSADAPGVQSYPVSQGWLHNTYVSSRTLVNASKLWDKVPVLHGQTTNNDDFFNDGQRWLTPKEFDAHTYLGVVAGVKSIFYYTFGKTGIATVNGLNIDKADIWNKSIQVKSELKSLEQVLLFGQLHTTEFNPNYDVYYGWWIYGDKVYVIAINSFQPERANPVRNISINLPSNVSNPTPLFLENGRNNTLSLNNGVFSGTMQPTDVQMYVMDYKDPIVLNGGFDNAPTFWNITGNAQIITEGENKILKANSNANATSINRDLRYRILPKKTYTFSADLKGQITDGSVMAFVQFRDYKNQIIATHQLGVTSTGWETKSLKFTTPDAYGSAVVGVWRNDGSVGAAFIDNIKVEEEGETGDSVSDSFFRLESKASKQWMKTKNCSTDYDGTVPLVVAGTNETGDCTMFEFIPTDNGYYYLQNKATEGRYRSKNCSNTADDSVEIVQATPTAFGWCEQWKLVDAGDEYYRIENRQTGGWIRSKGCSGEIGTSITQVTTGYTGDCTKWKLVDAGTNNRISEISETVDKSISFYPNPASNELILRIDTSLKEIRSIRIYDLQGSVVKEISKDELKENTETSIDVSGITDGLYILSIDFIKKETQNARFIIKH